MMEPQQHDTGEIVAKARQGDRDSIATLFTLYSDRIYRFLRFRLSDDATAEDLTQVVFLEMIRSLPRYTIQRNAKFTTWLFQIARHRLIDHYRRQRPTVAIDAESLAAHPQLQTDPPPIDDGHVEAAMQQLPERYQTVLHLRFREDCSYAEAAKILGTTQMNVRVLQHRALRALRRIMTKEPQP